MKYWGEGLPVKFEKESGLLLCPCCGDQYVHHSKITTFGRSEDEKETVKTVVDEVGRTAIEVVGSRACGNPSDRRNGFIIEFWCEACHAIFEMKFAQHKGVTMVWNEKIGEMDPIIEDDDVIESIKE